MNRRLLNYWVAAYLFMKAHGMEETSNVTTESAAAAPALTQEQILNEATETSAAGEGEFTFGGRKFQVVSLKYRQYLQFIGHLRPILELVGGKLKSSINDAISNKARVGLPGIALQALSEIEPSLLFRFCADELPIMVELVCNMKAIRDEQFDDLVTAKWVEDHAETPFELVDIILKQVHKNNMIAQFADFFVQVLPLFLGKRAESTQK